MQYSSYDAEGWPDYEPEMPQWEMDFIWNCTKEQLDASGYDSIGEWIEAIKKEKYGN